MKRILSFILSVCMIISLVPMISASAEEGTAYQLVYHFTQVDEFRNATPYCNKVDSANYMIPENVTFEGTYGMWAFYEQYGIDGWDTNQAFQYRKNYSEIKTNGEGSYFAVKINVPYTSEYTADLRYYQYKGSGNTNANVYLVAGNTANVASPTETEKIADIATDVPFVISSGSSDYRNADAVNLPLPAGEYILVFYVTTPATTSSSANRIRPVSLTLTSGSTSGGSYAIVPAYINKAELAKTSFEINESTSYEFSGWMNDYAAFDEASANVTVTSENGCVSIDTSAKSITAVKNGDDVISFSVENGGKTITKQVEISVIGNSGSPNEPGGDEDEDEDGKVRYEYNLNLGIENHTNTTGYAANAVTDYATSEDTWIYFAKTAGTAYGYAKKYIEIKSDVGEYFAIKMKVPRNRIYDVSLTQYLHAANGGYFDLYLLPGDTEKTDIPELLVDDNKLNKEAIRGFAETDTQDSTTKVTSKREIAAGEYVFVFYATSLGDNGTGTTAWMYPAMVTLSSVATDSAQKKAEDAFDPTETSATGYVESTVTGLTTDSTIEARKNSDGTFTLTAPETKDSAKFLYWAKGMSKNKKIVSFSNELSKYMPEENGKNYLIAVYEGDVTETPEYYNANGQRIATGTAPELPSMAGYGKASDWNRYGETEIYVAKYDKAQPVDVTVTVKNGNGTATVPYGEAVTCTADETNGNFLWWQKDVKGEIEIVSVHKSYTFHAYKDCTVTAVYGNETISVVKPAKIIIDIFGDNSVMAEFIGFGSNVVEKGIMFNGNKIAMTSPGNQFTITADKNGIYKGYAIVKDDGGYTLVTDGEVKITIEE